MKSGLDATFAINRIKTAHALAQALLRKEHAGYTTREINPVFVTSDNEHKRTGIEDYINCGGFEVEHSGKLVGQVLFRINVIKPEVHFARGHEQVAKALALAFKQHAKWTLKPKVKKLEKVEGVAAYLKRVYPVGSRREEPTDRAKREAEKLRME